MIKRAINLDDLINNAGSKIVLKGIEYDVLPVGGDVYETVKAATDAGTFGLAEMRFVASKAVQPPIPEDILKSLPIVAVKKIFELATGDVSRVEEEIVPLSSAAPEATTGPAADQT